MNEIITDTITVTPQMRLGMAIREARLKKHITLNKMASIFNIIYYSKLERGLSYPPSIESLDKLLEVFQISPGSKDYTKILALVEESRNAPIPPPLTELELLGKLPAFMCMETNTYTNKQLDDLCDIIKESQTFDAEGTI